MTKKLKQIKKSLPVKNTNDDEWSDRPSFAVWKLEQQAKRIKR